MFGKFSRRKQARNALQQPNRIEMLEDRRLLTVSNVQVTPAAATIDEGRTVEVQFAAQTDGTITRWVVDLGDGQGPLTYGGSLQSLNVWYGDGDSARTITATAHDVRYEGETPVYHSGSAAASVSVRNVAPTFSVQAPQEVYVNEPTQVSWVNFFDPGQDTVGAWELDWGDGTVETYDGNVGTFEHTYDRELNAQVILTAIDEDGRHAAQAIDQQVKYKHVLQVDHATGPTDDETFSGTVAEATNPGQWVDGVEVVIRMTDAEKTKTGVISVGAEQDPTTIWTGY